MFQLFWGSFIESAWLGNVAPSNSVISTSHPIFLLFLCYSGVESSTDCAFWRVHIDLLHPKTEAVWSPPPTHSISIQVLWKEVFFRTIDPQAVFSEKWFFFQWLPPFLWELDALLRLNAFFGKWYERGGFPPNPVRKAWKIPHTHSCRTILVHTPLTLIFLSRDAPLSM